MRRAFVIGCSSYKDPLIADLSYCHEDAAHFTTTLQEVCGFDHEGVCLLADERDADMMPTRANILRALTDRSSADTRPPDLLILFFSGHGFHSQASGGDFLVPYETVAAVPEDTSISFQRVVELLLMWEAKHTVMFVDACRDIQQAGKATVNSLAPLDPSTSAPAGLITFQSCQSGQVSFESDALRRGVFTFAITQALSEVGRCKTVYELDAFLVREVPRLSGDLGKPRQDPWSRVEPLGAQHVSLVSESKRHEWTANTPLGEERRTSAVSRANVPSPVTCAIDFGTSFSAIAVVGSDGISRLVPDSRGRVLVPSVVAFDEKADYLVGWDALDAEASRPELTLQRIKRRLGTPRPFSVLGRTVVPELAASLIIRALKRNAEEFVGGPVGRAIVSQPANFTYSQANALARAYDWAGFDVIRAVAEPSIAALLLDELLRAEHDPEQPFLDEPVALIIDLGGGTLDVSVAEAGTGHTSMTEGLVIEILGGAGDDVGGVDYDDVLVDELRKAVQEQLCSSRELSAREQLRARQEAERAKIELNHKDIATLMLPDVEIGPGELSEVRVTVNRDRFRELTAPLNNRIKRAVEGALNSRSDYGRQSARRRFEEDGRFILLTGQATKLFVIKELLDSMKLPGEIVRNYQENAVTLGLAMQLNVLGGDRKDLLLLDSRMRSIVIRCADVVYEDGARPRGPVVRIKTTEENRRAFTLVNGHTPIPWRDSLDMETDQDEIELVLAEGEMSDGREARIATIPLAVPSSFELTIDIDENSTAVLIVATSTEQLLALQLNNLHREPSVRIKDIQKLSLPPSA